MHHVDRVVKVSCGPFCCVVCMFMCVLGLQGYVSMSAINGCYLLWLMMYHEDHRVGRQVGEGTATVAARPVTNIETRPVRIVVEDASVIRRVDCKLRLLFTLRKLCAGWHYVICPPDNPYAHSC